MNLYAVTLTQCILEQETSITKHYASKNIIDIEKYIDSVKKEQNIKRIQSITFLDTLQFVYDMNGSELSIKLI